MYFRIVMVSLILAGSVHAGIYNTTDMPEETARLSQDFEGVFRNVLLNLRSIPDPTGKPNPPIRRRYVLIESLGSGNLRTLEAKLDFSAVLLRRGKAEEAVALLTPLTVTHDKNFVLLAQCAMAHFLSTNSDLKDNTLVYMRQAMELWPERWDQLSKEQQQFLTTLGWHETTLRDNRQSEMYLHRLMKSRLKEDRMRRKKLPVPETLDPLFGPADAPAKFVNAKGEFIVGQIPMDELKKLPKDPWDPVERLLIWMPGDERLLWLLGETLNADVMNKTAEQDRNIAIRNAAAVFKKLSDEAFGKQQMYGRKQVEARHKAFNEVVAKLPALNVVDPQKFGIRDPDLEDKPITTLTDKDWWRALIVGSVTGFAVGLFALWQFQEMRRRGR